MARIRKAVQGLGLQGCYLRRHPRRSWSPRRTHKARLQELPPRHPPDSSPTRPHILALLYSNSVTKTPLVGSLKFTL